MNTSFCLHAQVLFFVGAYLMISDDNHLAVYLAQQEAWWVGRYGLIGGMGRSKAPDMAGAGCRPRQKEKGV